MKRNLLEELSIKHMGTNINDVIDYWDVKIWK